MGQDLYNEEINTDFLNHKIQHWKRKADDLFEKNKKLEDRIKLLEKARNELNCKNGLLLCDVLELQGVVEKMTNQLNENLQNPESLIKKKARIEKMMESESESGDEDRGTE